MEIAINGKTASFTQGETVLAVAKRAGIEIPHLCALDLAPAPAAACRMCVVEVEGSPKLATSCTLEARDGMKVHTHTPRVLKVRRNITELLIASHPQDCLVCARSATCELSRIAASLGVRERRFTGAKKSHPIDISSPALVRDPCKCVLCGRCVTTCRSVQGVGAIDFMGRGFGTRVGPAFDRAINVSGCIFCGQCVRACPTGALIEKSHVDRVIAALADPRQYVVAQVAPAVPATLMEDVGASTVHDALGRLCTALKGIGFDAVFDTCFAADLTIREEAAELVSRIRGGGPLPMFTSCSPGWIRWVELNAPELIPHLSTCKSPQQMAGTLIKKVLPGRVDLAGRRLVCVSIMPCTAKKAEADDLGDVDFVLTTRELEQLFDRFGRDLGSVSEASPLDPPFSTASGAGRLFGGTGGVLEAAVRTAQKLLTGEEPAGKLRLEDARGLEGIKSFAVDVGGMRLGMGVVNGLGRLRPILDDIAAGRSKLHFIEVMTCPGGCVGGGGQPYDTDLDAIRARLESLYAEDRRSDPRSSHQNAEVQAIYDQLLGEPLSERSHHLLHRSYVARTEVWDSAPRASGDDACQHGRTPAGSAGAGP